MVEQVGCLSLFLPRYSPDLNLLEPLWNQTKHIISHLINSFREAIDDAFMQPPLLDVLQKIAFNIQRREIVGGRPVTKTTLSFTKLRCSSLKSPG